MSNFVRMMCAIKYIHTYIHFELCDKLKILHITVNVLTNKRLYTLLIKQIKKKVVIFKRINLHFKIKRKKIFR